MPTREELSAMGFRADTVSIYRVKKTGLRRTCSDVPDPVKTHKPKKQVMVVISKGFDYGLPWTVKGGSFFCKVREEALTDEDCMLWCKAEDCQFFQKGYFRVTESGKKKAVLK